MLGFSPEGFEFPAYFDFLRNHKNQEETSNLGLPSSVVVYYMVIGVLQLDDLSSRAVV